MDASSKGCQTFSDVGDNKEVKMKKGEIDWDLDVLLFLFKLEK